MKKFYLSLLLVIALVFGLAATTFAVPPKPGVVAPVDEKGMPLYLKLDQPRDISKMKAIGGVWTGEAQVLVIMMEFKDKSFPVNMGQAYWNNLLQGTANPVSMKKFYETVSYGQFTTKIGFSPVVKVSETLAYYGADAGSAHDVNVREAIVEALNILNSQNFNFSPYDVDRDGKLDHVIFIQAGEDQAGGAPSYHIWSHRSSFSYQIGESGYTLDGYTIQPVDGQVGVFCHEFGHDLGIPDYDDRDYTSGGLGNWDLMAGGSWNGTPGGSNPAQFGSFNRVNLGWMDFTTLTKDTVGLEVPNLEENPVAYKIWTEGKAGSEYFIIENRQPIYTDKDLPGHGLLIFHVEESNEGIQNDQEFNCFMALEQADGKFDLEFNVNSGDAADTYPGITNNRSFTNTSVPDSKSLAGINTFVSINNISNSGVMMTVDVALTPNVAPITPLVVFPIHTVKTHVITFQWKSVEGATNYDFEISTDPTFATDVLTYQTVLTKQTMILDYSTTYYWRLRASNNLGTSPWCAPVAFKVADKADIVVLIDDGEPAGIEPFYLETLEAMGIHYNVVDLFALLDADPTAEALLDFLGCYGDSGILNYKTVIYAGDWGLLLSYKLIQNLIGSAMRDYGVNFLISAQDNGWGAGAGYVQASFYEGILKTKYIQDSSQIWKIAGITGTPFEGLDFRIDGGCMNQMYPDEVDPIAPAIAILKYVDDVTTNPGSLKAKTSENFLNNIKPLKENRIGLQGIKSSGSAAVFYDAYTDENYAGAVPYKVVNVAFGLEGISTLNDRVAVLGKILNLLSGEDSTVPVVTNVSITDLTAGSTMTAAYTVDKAVTVDIAVKSGTTTIATLLTKVGYPAGEISIIWDGLTVDGDLIPAGNYTMVLTARDLAGNITVNEKSFAVIGSADIFRASFSTEILTPNGDNNNDSLTITANLTENATINVEVFDAIANVSLGLILTNVPQSAGEFTINWDATIGGHKVPDGQYKIKIYAVGPSGQDQVSATLLVDGTNPVFTQLLGSAFVAPASPIDPSVNLSGNAATARYVVRSSEVAQLKMEFILDVDGIPTVVSTLKTVIGSTSTIIDFSALDKDKKAIPNGEYTVRATLTDDALNSSVDESLKLIVDYIPIIPANVTINPLVANQFTSVSDEVTLTYTLDESTSISYLTLRPFYPFRGTVGGSVLYTFDEDSQPQEIGTHELVVPWRDTDGSLLLTPGFYTYRLRLYDVHTTNKIYLYPFQVVGYEIVSPTGDTFELETATVNIPKGALTDDTELSIRSELSIALPGYGDAPAYADYMEPTRAHAVIESRDPDLVFVKPVELIFDYTSEMVTLDNPNFVVYRWDGTSWLPLATVVDAENYVVTAKTNKPGTFVVINKIGDGGFVPDVAEFKAGFTVNPFSPNGDGVKDTTICRIDLPWDAKVTLKIYDHNGNLAKTLINGLDLSAGYHTNFVWDGSNNAGEILPSGMYIFKYAATYAGGTIEKTGIIGILK